MALPESAGFERTAINRVSFGARDTDVVYARQIGWHAWVEEQLAAPPGDDDALAAHLARQVMAIKYPAATTTAGGWPAVDELRPLSYLNRPIAALWAMALNIGRTVPINEIARIQHEIAAATWIRNAQARFQVREFMVDFWHNHFNISRDEDLFGAVALPHYDRVIRQHAFGNFRAMVEAVAASTSMLLYLDNAGSIASLPNENYARELLELHTLGEGNYLGVNAADVPRDTLISTSRLQRHVTRGFTDQDILHASRALSGWTVKAGQESPAGRQPITGEFFFNAYQHHPGATGFMGQDLTFYAGDLAQGRFVMDIAAYHPGTADFVCAKLINRIFGAGAPAAVHARAVAAWLEHRESADQIARVVRAILRDGDEIGALPPAKLRRPYERVIALARTAGIAINASDLLAGLLAPLGDTIFVWPTPDGRPDDDAYWMSTSAAMTTWNVGTFLPYIRENGAFLTALVPAGLATATEIAEFWVGQMIGRRIAPAAMAALVADAAASGGVVAGIAAKNAVAIEVGHRRLTSLIAMTEEFSFR